MKGIIDWNELWKLMRMSSSLRRTLDEDAGSHGDKYAKKCNESMIRSKSKERTEMEIPKIETALEYTVLDVGAGTGRFAIPIAKCVKTVTAIDPSKGMLACLQENMEKEEVENITCINKRCEDVKLGVDIEQHDVVIASHSVSTQEVVAKMDAASKNTFISSPLQADGWMGDGEEEEGLWKAIYGERHRARAWGSDYMFFCNLLHDMKIYANVDIRDVELEQRYESYDDAVTKWKEMCDIPAEKEGILRDHLSKILVEDDGTFCFKRKTKSATIWWQKKIPEKLKAVKV